MTFRSTHLGQALVAATFVLLLPATLLAQRQNGLLVGRVLSGDVAVPSATILVSGGRATLARVDGRYRMSLPAGRYEVRAQRIGYASGRDTITIAGGVTSTVNFRLYRAVAMLEAVSAIGTRGPERTVIDAPVPIDVYSGVELRATGRTETAEMIQALAPNITVPHASVGEGSDVIHPATMHGLGPDQLLVLVNGKRRHQSALVNVNGTVGRGSTGVDLNAIPASMIDRVEIMRDGAVAQYGSDAVAGVINVVLKSGVHGDATTTVGEHVTTLNRSDAAAASYPSGERSARDGRRLQASIDKGVVFGARGFLHGAFELRDRGFTNRSLADLRPQSTGIAADRLTNRSGDAASHDVALFLNGGNLFDNGLELYGNAGGSRRTVESASYFRTSTDPRTPLAMYPNGFLPIIRPVISDYAGTVGLRGVIEEWAWDLSTTYGRNRVGYDVKNSTNGVTPGLTELDAGAVRYAQSTTTLEITTHLPMLYDARFTAGAELRTESYTIDAAGSPSPASIQGFAGFGPAQVVDRSRRNVAGYVDTETDLTPSLLMGVAGRIENYNDVGTTGAGKLSLRWEPARNVVFRGSVGRGYRAPSLAQSSYSTAAVDPGASPDSPAILRVDQASAASPLRPERSTNFSLGFAVEPSSALSFQADVYRVLVSDRTLLLDDVSISRSGAAYYVRNGIATRADGVDLSANYGLRFDNGGSLRLTTALDYGSVIVTDDGTVGNPFGLGLGRRATTRIERGQPRTGLLGSAAYKRGAFGALLRAQRFGDVTSLDRQSIFEEQRFGARWLTDANASYTIRRQYTFTVGADNLFDVYPDRNNVSGNPVSGVQGNGYFGILPYNGRSPFGFNGRFVYGRLAIYL